MPALHYNDSSIHSLFASDSPELFSLNWQKRNVW